MVWVLVARRVQLRSTNSRSSDYGGDGGANDIALLTTPHRQQALCMLGRLLEGIECLKVQQSSSQSRKTKSGSEELVCVRYQFSLGMG